MAKKVQTINVKKLIDDSVSKAISELKNEGFMKDQRRSTFQKVEQLLYNYTVFQASIDERIRQMEFTQENGLQKKSKDILCFSSLSGGEKMDPSDKLAEYLGGMQRSIEISRKYLLIIDGALKMVEGDVYYDLIRLKYFEGWGREELANHFGCDVSTVTRNKNRLINTLRVYLFSDEVIRELFA